MSRIPTLVAESSGDRASTPARPDRGPAQATRRGFLGKGLAAAGASALVAGPAADRASAATSNSAIRSAASRAYFQEIQKDESVHVAIVTAEIRALGGTPRPYPTFQNITTSDPQTLLKLAVAFENTGVSAYLGALPYIFNPNVRSAAGSLALVEGLHSGWLNSLAGQPLVPGGLNYTIPATIPQVVNAVSPFLVSLNDGGAFPATFSTEPSTENDIAILNFALLLEYLEGTFYFESVPRTFA